MEKGKNNIWKAIYENHTIILKAVTHIIKIDVELEIDDRVFDSYTIGLEKKQIIDLKGTFVEDGKDYIVLIRIVAGRDIMTFPTMYINNQEIPITKIC